MREKADLPSFLLEHTPWLEEASPIWPATSFVLHRNLARYNFPPKLTESAASNVLNLLRNALFDTKLLKEPLFLKSEELSPLDKEFLFEHFLCLEGFQQPMKNQGFVVADSALFLAMINIQDHLQLHMLDCKANWEHAYTRLSTLDTFIGKHLEYAFTPKFGYLTSDPKISGVALLVRVFLHLPALIHTGNALPKEEEVTLTSLQGPLENSVGDIVVLQNSYTLGLSEENILRSLQAETSKLISLESALRNELKTKNNANMKDQVSRAFGLLLHSYQLQTKEALDALSLIKLGVHLGWVIGMTDTKINDIFFKCRHAHLSYLLQEKKIATPEALAHKRAEFIHQQLAGVTLQT